MDPTKQDIYKIALSTEANKTFCLLEVKAIYVHGCGANEPRYSTIWYEIDLDNNLRLAAIYLHTFACLRGDISSPRWTSDLRKGDKIWVDVGQFLCDGSFTMRKPKPKTTKKENP